MTAVNENIYRLGIIYAIHIDVPAGIDNGTKPAEPALNYSRPQCEMCGFQPPVKILIKPRQ